MAWISMDKGGYYLHTMDKGGYYLHTMDKGGYYLHTSFHKLNRTLTCKLMDLMFAGMRDQSSWKGSFPERFRRSRWVREGKSKRLEPMLLIFP